MNVSRRFFVLNILAILFTLAMTGLAVVIFIASYTTIFKNEAGMEDLKRVIEVKAGFSEIKRKAMVPDPEKVLDLNYQQTLSAAVKALGADVAIVRNREVVFSTRVLKKMDIEKSLAFTHEISNSDTLELDGKTYIFDKVDFNLKNGDTVVLILLAPIKLKTHFYQFLVFFTITFFILSFLGMNLWISVIFSKKVITPVSRLKAAAARISAGDLSCEIVEEGEGEMRELCRTLEQMRIKLKESIYLQSKYDENRKFLISSISHDLKTPVTSIKGYIEGILDGVAKTPEKMERYLETARSKAILVNSMIDDLLLYSKLDLNQIPFNFERTEVANYFEYCIADNRYEFEKVNIKITLQNELKEAVFILIDKERLKRVIQNILDNARKYMTNPDGQVTLLLRETHTSVIIEIRDNGKGIPEKDLPFIFERFYRADSSRKSDDGSGLGLAIARQIVEGHEGRIWAVSNEGEGTSIILSLKKH